MHEHKVCEHKLKYCQVCDVVYCEKCNKEWYTNKYVVTYSPPMTYPTISYTIGEGEVSDPYTNKGHNHSEHS